MNPELVLRLIELVRRHGDRLVLADPETGRGVVVMDLAAYERMANSVPAEYEPISHQIVSHGQSVLTAGSNPNVEAVPKAQVTEEPLFESEEIQSLEVVQQEDELAQSDFVKESANPKPVDEVIRPEPVRPTEVPEGVRPLPTEKGPRRTSSFDKPAMADLSSLTPDKLTAKMHGDVGDWKKAKSRQNDEDSHRQKAATRREAQVAEFEEEEHFFLEPIE